MRDPIEYFMSAEVTLSDKLLEVLYLVIGLLCTRPAIGWIERLFFQSGAEGLSATLLTDSISIPQMLMLIPLCIVFSLISGGIPAYMITRKNISSMLKGGSHD